MSNNNLPTYDLHSIETIVSHYDRIIFKENTPITLGQILEIVKNGGSFKETIQEIRTTVGKNA